MNSTESQLAAAQQEIAQLRALVARYNEFALHAKPFLRKGGLAEEECEACQKEAEAMGIERAQYPKIEKGN